MSQSSVRSIVERCVAAAGLVACSPVLLAAALCIVAESGRPVFFRQTRVGQGGRLFPLLKLRSMRTANAGAPITAGGDPRVTRVGSILRKYKLDELPQLWNVVAGHMQLIGPRPEVPRFVDQTDPVWLEILRERPGLTDLSTLVYRNEESVLSNSADPVRVYSEEILPRKNGLSSYYSRTRTIRRDCRLLVLTVKYSLFPAGFDSDRVLRSFQEQA